MINRAIYDGVVVDGKKACMERVNKTVALKEYLNGGKIAILGCDENPLNCSCEISTLEEGHDKFYFSLCCRSFQYYMKKALGAYLSFYKVDYVEV